MAETIGSKLNISKEQVPEHIWCSSYNQQTFGRALTLTWPCCLRVGTTLLPDVSAWNYKEGVGGFGGQNHSGAQAEWIGAPECVSGCYVSLFLIKTILLVAGQTLLISGAPKQSNRLALTLVKCLFKSFSLGKCPLQAMTAWRVRPMEITRCWVSSSLMLFQDSCDLFLGLCLWFGLVCTSGWDPGTVHPPYKHQNSPGCFCHMVLLVPHCLCYVFTENVVCFGSWPFPEKFLLKFLLCLGSVATFFSVYFSPINRSYNSTGSVHSNSS